MDIHEYIINTSICNERNILSWVFRTNLRIILSLSTLNHHHSSHDQPDIPVAQVWKKYSPKIALVNRHYVDYANNYF